MVWNSTIFLDLYPDVRAAKKDQSSDIANILFDHEDTFDARLTVLFTMLCRTVEFLLDSGANLGPSMLVFMNILEAFRSNQIVSGFR